MNKFDPVDFSIEENQFLVKHLGEPPIVAARSLTPTIAKKGVMSVLERVQELEQIKSHTGAEWCGIQAIKDSIMVYLEQAEKWASDKRRGRIRFPSMYSYDSRKRPHWSGTGADCGKVKTYFNAAGERVPFAVVLVDDGVTEWTPDFLAPTEVVDDTPKAPDIKLNAAASRFECFCGHTDEFKAESRASFTAARGRMGKHCKNATSEVERHREAYTLEFGE